VANRQQISPTTTRNQTDSVPGSHLVQVPGQHAVQAGLVSEPTTDDLVRQEIEQLKDRVAILELAVNSPPEGWHNADSHLFDRVLKAESYREQTVVMLMPTIKPIHPKVAFSWLSVMTPANHRVFRMAVTGGEVADAYNVAIRHVLETKTLSDMRYVCTFESDNIVPPHGLLQLLGDIAEFDLDGVAGCYFTKGPGGVCQCWGKFGEVPHNFRPFIPPPNSVTRCNAIAMGFSLFKLDLFKRVSQPWFKTVQHFSDSFQHESLMTQDMFFCRKAAQEAGAKFAVSTRVLVGHIDADSIIW